MLAGALLGFSTKFQPMPTAIVAGFREVQSQIETLVVRSRKGSHKFPCLLVDDGVIDSVVT